MQWVKGLERLFSEREILSKKKKEKTHKQKQNHKSPEARDLGAAPQLQDVAVSMVF